MKKILRTLIILLLITGCSEKITMISVPNYQGINLEHYLEDIEDINLKYRITEEFHHEIEKGEIISVDPSVGQEVEPETRILIKVSKGSDVIISTQSNIEWYNVGNEADKWKFYNPEIDFKKGEITIVFEDVTFGSNFELNDEYDSKSALVTAVVIDPYNKRLPASLEYDGSKEIKIGEARNFTMKIPISDLDVQKPTSIDTFIPILRNGNYEEIKLNFSISW